MNSKTQKKQNKIEGRESGRRGDAEIKAAGEVSVGSTDSLYANVEMEAEARKTNKRRASGLPIRTVPAKKAAIPKAEPASGGSQLKASTSGAKWAKTVVPEVEPPQNAKEASSHGEGVGEIGTESQELRALRAVTRDTRRFLLDRRNEVSERVVDEIISAAERYEDVLLGLILKNENLKGQLEERRRMAACAVLQPAAPPQAMTYASAARSGPRMSEVNGPPVSRGRSVAAGGSVVPGDRDGRGTGVTTQIVRPAQPAGFAVMVKAIPESESDSDSSVEGTRKAQKLLEEPGRIKNLMISKISKTLPVRVRAIRKTRTGVVIETVTEEERKQLIASPSFAKLGLEVEKLSKVGPKVIVYDVPNGIAEEAFLESLYERNLVGVLPRKEFRETTRVVTRNSKKDAGEGNVILELAVAARDHM